MPRQLFIITIIPIRKSYTEERPKTKPFILIFIYLPLKIAYEFIWSFISFAINVVSLGWIEIRPDALMSLEWIYMRTLDERYRKDVLIHFERKLLFLCFPFYFKRLFWLLCTLDRLATDNPEKINVQLSDTRAGRICVQ